MQKLSLATLTVISFASCTSTLEREIGDEYVDEIVSARDFDSLVHPVNELARSGTEDTIRAIVQDLYSRIQSEERLAFTPNWDGDEFFAFAGWDGLECVPDELRRKHELPWKTSYTTVHNLRTVGGRSLWALERILAIDLPPLMPGITKEKSAKFEQEIKDRVTSALRKIRKEAMWPQLSEQERVKLAASHEVHDRIIAELARDTSRIVRLEVAKNPYLCMQVMQWMRKNDEDAEIRQNKKRGRG